jgi:hypothetical protein
VSADEQREALERLLRKLGMGYGLHDGMRQVVLTEWADAILAAGWASPEVLAERDEQVAALQAQLDAVREFSFMANDDGVMHDGTTLDRILAAVPSDTLAARDARVAAEALEEAADETVTHTTIGQRNERTKREVPALSANVREHLRARAAAIRAGVTS